MKKLILPVVIALGVYLLANTHRGDNSPVAPAQSTVQSDASLTAAFENHASDVQVSGEGTVLKVLPDDNEGSRHQRFILQLASGQTLLVAHNIDLASRVPALRAGDTVGFSGEYKWNEKGGVLHWTHHDPANAHSAGWLEYEGKRYE